MRHHLTSENGYDHCLICGGQWPISEDGSTEPDTDCLGLAPGQTSWYHGQGEIGCPDCGVDVGGQHGDGCNAVPVQPGACDCALCDPAGLVADMEPASVALAYSLTQAQAFAQAGAKTSITGYIILTSAIDAVIHGITDPAIVRDARTLANQLEEDYATL